MRAEDLNQRQTWERPLQLAPAWMSSFPSERQRPLSPERKQTRLQLETSRMLRQWTDESSCLAFAERSMSLRFFLRPRLSLFWMHQISNSDARQVKRDHRRRENAHIQNVRGRSNDGRDNENHENRITHVAPHPTRAPNSHEGQKEH